MSRRGQTESDSDRSGQKSRGRLVGLKLSQWLATALWGRGSPSAVVSSCFIIDHSKLEHVSEFVSKDEPHPQAHCLRPLLLSIANPNTT